MGKVQKRRIHVTPKHPFWSTVETRRDVRFAVTAAQWLLGRWAWRNYLCSDDDLPPGSVQQWGTYRVQESWTGLTMCVYIINTADRKREWSDRIVAAWESVELTELPMVKLLALSLAAWLNGISLPLTSLQSDL